MRWVFVKLVEIVGGDVCGKKCVVLGTDGAAMTAAVAVRGLGADMVVHVLFCCFVFLKVLSFFSFLVVELVCILLMMH